MAKGKKLKTTILLVFILAGGLIFGKAIQARRLQQNFENYIGGGEYAKAVEAYSSAANDIIINNMYNFEKKTQPLISEGFNQLVEKYMNKTITYDSFQENVGYILKLNNVDRDSINKSVENISDIEKYRQALELSQKLFMEKQYEKALESLDAIKKIDTGLYANVASLKEDINMEFKETIIKEIDALVGDRKFAEAQKLLDAKGDKLDSGDIERKKQEIEKAHIEYAVSEYESKTSYLITVDIRTQLTTVFEGKKGKWKLIKKYISSTGIAGRDTPTGDFVVTDRGAWFYTPRFSQGAKYWVRFYKTYLFHSLPMDSEGNIVDSTLGVPLSHGCVRLNVDEAKWIYENIPSGTRVIVK